MKNLNSDLRGSHLRVFRPMVIGSVLLLFVLFALFQIKGRVANADTTFLSVTGTDSLLLTSMPGLPVSKIAPEVVADTANDKHASVVILMADQANVNAAYSMKDQDARGWYVYNTLKNHADRTQADIKAFLTARGIEYQSFWAANMLVASVDLSTAEDIAARADVARVDSNRAARWIEDPAIADYSVAPDSPNTTEWGVQNVNAPQVWALGHTGEGIVVGDLDTGMRWTHIALQPKYRGWNGTTADHNYNWHDSIHSGGGTCGANTTAPCDDNGHGTHTAGSMVGDDGAGNQIGVAPGARWIGCRNMDQGNGTPATYTECFQFAIAPTDLSGNNPNPTLRPHVLNNSWGCPASEGCTTRAEIETIVNNTQASGIFVEVSAGNAGPGCSSVTDPPAIYSASFSTGAISQSNTLAGFSSRGPSTYYTPNLLKPNISAPGSNVRSSYGSGDTTFANLSGTSMAGPHVCGVIALLWSAHPELTRNIDATKTLLQNTANPNVVLSPTPQTCGGTSSTQIPNNIFGYGRVDALAAVNGAGSTPTSTPTPAGTPSITGTVTYANAIGAPVPRPVSGVLVSGAGSPPVSSTTDGSGTYSLTGFGAGSYTITPSKTGNQNGAITSFDAGRIAQYVVGSFPFSAVQRAVADVSGAGGISSFDAAEVAHYAVSEPSAGMTGNWIFSPASNTHASVTGNLVEDYAALLMGEVSGNWLDAGARPMASDGPQHPIQIAASRAIKGRGNDITVPVTVRGIAGKGVISYEFDLRYDASVVSPQTDAADVARTVSGGLFTVCNTSVPGLLRVAVYGPTPITRDGILLNLRFTAIGQNGSASPLQWERVIFNEGEPRVTAADGNIALSTRASAKAILADN